MTHSKISIILLLSLILCKSNGYIMANPMAPNDTAAWTQVGLTDKLVLTFAMMGTNIFAGTEEGIFLSTNDGTSWTPINNGIPNFHWVTSLAVDGTKLFAGTDDEGVYLSTNNGTTWSPANNGLINTWVTSLAVSGTDLFAGTQGGLWGTNGGGVYCSTDHGANWFEVNNGLTDTSISALAVMGTNLFAGTNTAGVFLSTNNGTSWSSVNNDIPHNWGIEAFAVNDSNLYVSSEAYGIFVSTNNGIVWSAIDSGYNYSNSIATDGSNLFIGGSSGVFLSTKSGKDWNQLNVGLSDTLVSTLAVSSAYLFAGNTAQVVPVSFRGQLLVPGIWRYPLSQVGMKVENNLDHIPFKFTLNQNYPNPFNPSTTISFSLESKSFLTLKIFDIVGREVATLVNEELPAGTYSRQWSAANMSSGVYFCRLQSRSFSETKKLILLR